jgi:thiol-disulfide isomerase/thioredoxin
MRKPMMSLLSLPKTIVFSSILCVVSCLPPAVGGELSAVEPSPRVELVLPVLEGGSLGLDEHRGKVVVVNFWASWCPPCIEEMPGIQRLAEEMRGKPFQVIAVNVGDDELKVKRVVKHLGIGFPVLLDRDSAMFNRWGADVLPTTYVLDTEGAVRYVGRGPLEWDGSEIREILEGLAAIGEALGSRESSN